MEPERIFKRKIYDRLLKWKQESNGKTALRHSDVNALSMGITPNVVMNCPAASN